MDQIVAAVVRNSPDGMNMAPVNAAADAVMNTDRNLACLVAGHQQCLSHCSSMYGCNVANHAHCSSVGAMRMNLSICCLLSSVTLVILDIYTGPTPALHPP